MSATLSISSCWKAFKLFIPVYGFGLAYLIYLFWLFLVTSLILVFNQVTPTLFLGLSLGCLIATIVIYEIFILIYQVLLKLLWSNPPKWLSPPPTLWKNLCHLGIGFLAMIPIIIIKIIDVMLIESMEYLTNTDIHSLYIVDFLIRFSPVWLLSAGLLYDLDQRLSLKRQKNKTYQQQH